MKIPRRFTKKGQSPYSSFKFVKRSSVITNPDGSVVHRNDDVTVPEGWSQVATDILAQKYFRRTDVPVLDENGQPIKDESGQVKKGEEVEIVGLRDEIKRSVVTGVEMFHKELEAAMAGDNAGVLLRGVDRDEIERGMVLAQPGSITPHKRFRSQVYILRQEEGGRHKGFVSGYRPQFYIRTMDVTGEVILPDDIPLVMPGDNVNLVIELVTPVALERGSKFAIREGGLTVGAGLITEILE